MGFSEARTVNQVENIGLSMDGPKAMHDAYRVEKWRATT
jgi:sulfatase maturation enzyme AslB (radical SAM superfamily)